MVKNAVIYRAYQHGEPVAIRPEFNDKEPPHADNLRYDMAYHHPDDPSVLVFPLFRHKSNGKYPDAITGARWRSFGTSLELLSNLSARMTEEEEAKLPKGVSFYAIHNLDDWFTYVHIVPGYTLEKITMREFKARNPKLVLVGFRQL